ncbi:MAG: 4Fe-4S dicluster domain-containing protein [Chloroflexi bacterium]|nr:4Fe-4S dicluster domain-containing protein [Chloroflexota bacterium]
MPAPGQGSPGRVGRPWPRPASDAPAEGADGPQGDSEPRTVCRGHVVAAWSVHGEVGAQGLAPLHALGPSDADLYKCVHCGLCLSACPTYLETGLETESPRGRIALMKAVREGKVGYTGRVVSHLELCLQCRACEAACPSGVPFGRLMEHTRAQVKEQRPGSLLRRIALRAVFRGLLPHQGRLYALGGLLRLYQRSPLYWLMRRLPGRLGRLQEQLPPFPKRFFRPQAGAFNPPGEARARVALLSGCVMPILHGPTMEAAVRVLARNGCQVVTPLGQGCCGALNLHGGDREQAQAMARRNIDAFLETGVEAVVVVSAGCGAAMKEYPHLLQDDPAYAEKARRFSAMVVDVSEFLATLPLAEPSRSMDMRVTYQDACHLAHAQRVTRQPRDLLRRIPGVTLVEMEDASLCCGAAGLYMALQPVMSRQLMARKAKAILKTGAEVVVSGNPGCMVQMQAGLRAAGSAVRVAHLVDLLEEAYGE